eukprot:2979080-Prorocentrum_lima.AAC.1
MTSSLVGSEMCIRDRTSARARSAVGHRLHWHRGRVAGCQGARPSKNQEPVSYTHLTLPTICSV